MDRSFVTISVILIGHLFSFFVCLYTKPSTDGTLLVHNRISHPLSSLSKLSDDDIVVACCNRTPPGRGRLYRISVISYFSFEFLLVELLLPKMS